MESMQYMQPSDYFTKEEIQQFIKITTNRQEIGDIVVYDFKSDDYDRLDRLSIVEVTKEIDCYDKQYRKYLHYANYYEGTGFFINSQMGEHIPLIIAKLAETDKSSAQKMLHRYHQTYLQSQEAISAAPKIIKDTHSMIDYLDKTNTKFKDLNIDVDSLHKIANDEEALEKEINHISKNFPKKVEVKGYNDSDYYPYLFDNFYIIEDTASDKMLLCKKEGNKTSWYLKKRWPKEYRVNDWVNEILYENRQLSKAHIPNLNDFNLVVEYEGEKMTKATVEIDYLNGIQGSIVKDLVNKGKLKQDFPELSFEELVHNYAFQKEFYHIEERAIVELLQEIQIVDGKMTYEDFSLADPKKIKKTMKHEEISEHHMSDFRPPKPNEICAPDFSCLKKLEKKHVDSINEYLAKLQDRDNTELTAKFISLINEKLPDYTAGLKKRM
jgi:hypothetical protein